MRIVLKPAGLFVVLLAISVLAVFAFTRSPPSAKIVSPMVAPATPSPVTTPANLAVNADMLAKGANGLPDGWGHQWSGRGKVSASQDMTEGGDSPPCLRIDTNDTDGQGQVAQMITVQPGERVTVGGAVKAQGIGTFSLAAQFYDSKLSPVGFEHILMATPGAGWQTAEKTVTIPEGASTLGIVSYADGTGRGWVDDVSVTRQP